MNKNTEQTSGSAPEEVPDNSSPIYRYLKTKQKSDLHVGWTLEDLGPTPIDRLNHMVTLLNIVLRKCIFGDGPKHLIWEAMALLEQAVDNQRRQFPGGLKKWQKKRFQTQESSDRSN